MGRNCDVPPHIPTDFTTPMRLVYVLMIAAALEKLVHVHLFLPRIFLPFLIARYERHTRHGRCDFEKLVLRQRWQFNAHCERHGSFVFWQEYGWQEYFEV
jgi:hypothetical protein